MYRNFNPVVNLRNDKTLNILGKIIIQTKETLQKQISKILDIVLSLKKTLTQIIVKYKNLFKNATDFLIFLFFTK